MQNPDTSRGAETEVLELIANLIASKSHHYEWYNSIQSDLKHPELYTEEQIKEMEEESIIHFNKMNELTEKRRHAMRILREMGPSPDNKRHCLLKHSIACFQFSQELLDTDMDNLDYIQLAEHAYQYMYECASKYLGVEIVTCGRCLNDILNENKNKNEEKNLGENTGIV